MFLLAIVTFSLVVVFQIGFASQIVVRNKCYETIWPAIFGRDPKAPAGQGYIYFDKLPTSGLSPNQTWKTIVQEAGNVTGRLWPRTGCKPNKEMLHCVTGDCDGFPTCNKTTASNTTLIEYNFEKDKVHYDVSLVDGFTIPVEIKFSNDSCSSLQCKDVDNNKCPLENQWWSPIGKPEVPTIANTSQLLGCKSNCSIYDTPQACCRGQYDTSDVCAEANPFFAIHCPQAYSYAYSETDRKVLHECQRGAEMQITFCP